MTDGILDEALERLRDTGPELDGWLTNHAPMAAEVMVRQGHAGEVHHWIDDYWHRLQDAPRGISPIARDEWRDPLGDPLRTGDWIAYFGREIREDPWRDVLARWWPRLLPGIAAGATHGVIRVGHAVRALLDEETGPRIVELAHGLAYWAARWQPLAPAGAGPYRSTDARSALDAVPRVPDQRFGIRNRLAQLADLAEWPGAAAAVPGDPGQDIDARLAGIVEAAVRRHATHGYGNPVLMVHAATAPLAVRRVLPALPASLAMPSLAAAWAASAAVTAAYSPAVAEPLRTPDATAAAESLRASDATAAEFLRVSDAAAAMERATDSEDAHAIKFADAAIEIWSAAPDPALLAAADHCTDMITRRV